MRFVTKLLLIKFSIIFCVIVGVIVCNSARNSFPKTIRVCNPKVCNSETSLISPQPTQQPVITQNTIMRKGNLKSICL